MYVDEEKKLFIIRVCRFIDGVIVHSERDCGSCDLQNGSHYAAGYFVNNGFSRMNDRIREATNGAVDIKFYESSQLGDYEQVFQKSCAER